MDSDFYRRFAGEKRAVVVAPAGCGKTELIARAVGCCPPESRQLVLTHTHAGVDAIRGRLRKVKVPASHYHVETIHSFTLRYAAAYPKSSQIRNIEPLTSEDYTDIAESAHRLIKTRLVREILSRSYGGVFVDEYQDCTIDQHDLIVRLAEVLPCRIVGDPLQGIFDFGNNQIVDWDQHIYPFFTRLPDLTEPWRWKGSNPRLGKWLAEIVRPALERREPIPLYQVLQAGICAWTQEISGQYGPAKRIKVLLEALNQDQTTFVICRPEREALPHHLASQLQNRYRSIEPVTSETLCRFAEAIEGHTGMDRLHAAYDFSSECLTGQQDFHAVFQAIRKGGKVKSDRRRALYELAMCTVVETSLDRIAALFEFVEKAGNPTIKRYQLWREMRRALSAVVSGTVRTLVEATHIIRNKGAAQGRTIPKRCISRTVLLKGLECDRAIVVDADSMDTKNLYVALTRGSRNLHIMSKEQVLWPSDAHHPCPRCHSALTFRRSAAGPLLVCSAYPSCRHTEPITKT